MAAIVHGDARRILAYSAPRELEQLGLSRLDAVALLEDLVSPRMKLASPTGSQTLWTNSGEASATATQLMTGSGGRVFPISCTVHVTDAGHKSNMLFQALIRAWQVEFHSRKTGPPIPKDMFEACLQGLAKDRAYLERLGLRGFYSASRIPGMDRHFRTFAEYEAHWERMVKLAEGP